MIMKHEHWQQLLLGVTLTWILITFVYNNLNGTFVIIVSIYAKWYGTLLQYTGTENLH